MHNINLCRTLNVEIGDDIPAAARDNLLSMLPPATGESHAEYSLKIRTWDDSEAVPGELFTVDTAYRIADRFLEVKCNYKFSKWRYRLLQRSATHWEMQIKGDFFSAWVWPFRTAGPVIRLLMQRAGYYYFHSAGLYNGRSAVMLMAPSGTGKTLTTMHFLCNGGKMYNDDTVLWHDGKIFPTMNSFNFWAYRYRNFPDVLPETLPVFHGKDRRKMRIAATINALSLGMVGLGAKLNIRDYWPESPAPVAPLERIIVLSKGENLGEGEKPDREKLVSSLLGDLEFQNIALLRLADVETLTGVRFLEAGRFFKEYRETLTEICRNTELLSLTVPSRYAREVFHKIDGMVRQ